MTTEATSGFMIFDLRKIVPGRGIKLSGCPYYMATEGNPTGGTATGAAAIAGASAGAVGYKLCA